MGRASYSCEASERLHNVADILSSSKHHSTLLSRLHEAFKAHPLSDFATRHRLPSLRGGHVARDGMWDKYLWSRMREGALGGVAGDKLRGVIVVGGEFRVALQSCFTMV